jgi:two-component system response regulator HydG
MTQQKANILVVDDDQGVLYTAKMILKPHFEHVQTESNPASALESFLKKDYDVVLLDMNFQQGATDGKEGMVLLKKMLKEKPDVHIITNTAYGDIDLAVSAMKQGARDFIVKPWQKEKLLATIQTSVELRQSQKELSTVKSRESILAKDIAGASGQLLWRDKVMEDVNEIISKVAQTTANVLILGENGTGKELVARAIHDQSNRARRPFIKVDVGTIPETLFESELFGHEKGAFTDARETKAGRFEVANGGTLFLDEIGNLPLNMQAKLLTAIQNRQIHRIGSSKPIDLDIRLVAATNKDLYHLVDEQDFRQDLLYRINTVEIHVPPLRNRPRDIPYLINHFLKQFSGKYEKKGLGIGEKEMVKLIDYSWPGNVRELIHAVERAVILGNEQMLKASDLITSNSNRTTTSKSKDNLNIESVEQKAIAQALDKTNGNLTKAAEQLGIGRTTLYRKMKKYQL